MTKDSQWEPDKSAALKALIRQTIESAGDIKPDALPHRIKDRLKDFAAGDVDLDQYIRDVLDEIDKDQE